MQIAYADTSFFASLYLRDINLPTARTFLAAHRRGLIFTSLQKFELINAIRLAVHRGKVTALQAQGAIGEIVRDVEAGNLLEGGLVWPEVLDAAEEIGSAHTAALGVRSLDLLHIAAAVSVEATTFLTFDRRQHEAAKAAGLKVI